MSEHLHGRSFWNARSDQPPSRDSIGQLRTLEAGAYRIVDTCGVRSVRRTVVLVEREDTLLRDLEAFVGEHRRCGELDGGVEGERVWFKS